MPILKQQASVLARGIRAFLSLEVGLVSDGSRWNQTQRVEQAEKRTEKQKGRIADQNRELEQVRRQLASKERELAKLRVMVGGDKTRARGVKPENIVWIFGTGRSGNTWLSSMMGEIEGHAVWSEPRVGMLFGEFYFYNSFEGQRKSKNFILGEKQKATWLESIRNFVLDGATSRFPEQRDGYLVVKEQVGSVGAPLLMEALPESRMILLVRDPRDVVSSILDASRTGGWHHERRKNDPGWTPKADENPNAFVEERAARYLKQVGGAKEAYDAHRGPKALVRYEELRADTVGTMRRMYSTLGVPVDGKEIARVVEEHAWENIPEEKRGEGKFYRKAQPGGWKEDLTPEQARTVEKITAPLLSEFYPEKA